MGEGSARQSNSDAQQQQQLDAWLNSPAGAQAKAALNSKDPRVSQGAMIGLGLQQNPEYLSKPGSYESFMDKFIPIATAIGSGYAFGPIIAGAGQGFANATVNNQNVLKGAAVGALSGAATQGAGALGVNPAISGAAIGALRSKFTGGSPANGAIVGGLSGAANGAVGSASGNPYLGQAAGTVAGTLANKYLTSPPSVAPAHVGTPAIMGSTPTSLPTLPGQQPKQVTPPPAPITPSPVNTGPYSGYSAGLGYQPRQEASMAGVDWANYGQGPEQNFFQPVSPSATTPRPVSTAPQGTITRTNSG